MENKNMFAVWSYDGMTEDTRFHGIVPRNWMAREAIEKMSVDYMDMLKGMGFMRRPTVEWGRNETSVTVTYGLHQRRFYFVPIVIGQIKPMFQGLIF